MNHLVERRLGANLPGLELLDLLSQRFQAIFLLVELAGITLHKSFFFGAAIAIISCHRGFNSRAGAEGVGRAATEAFVYSFIAILFLDFCIGLAWNSVYYSIWPSNSGFGIFTEMTAVRPSRTSSPERLASDSLRMLFFFA